MSNQEFIRIKGKCVCGKPNNDEVQNLRYWTQKPFHGWYAECIACKSTRFISMRLMEVDREKRKIA